MTCRKALNSEYMVTSVDVETMEMAAITKAPPFAQSDGSLLQMVQEENVPSCTCFVAGLKPMSKLRTYIYVSACIQNPAAMPRRFLWNTCCSTARYCTPSWCTQVESNGCDTQGSCLHIGVVNKSRQNNNGQQCGVQNIHK